MSDMPGIHPGFAPTMPSTLSAPSRLGPRHFLTSQAPPLLSPGCSPELQGLPHLIFKGLEIASISCPIDEPSPQDQRSSKTPWAAPPLEAQSPTTSPATPSPGSNGPATRTHIEPCHPVCVSNPLALFHSSALSSLRRCRTKSQSASVSVVNCGARASMNPDPETIFSTGGKM